MIEKKRLDNKGLGVTLMLGTAFSKEISNKCLLNLTPCVNYKLVTAYDSERPDDRYIPNDTFYIGFKLGIEYLFKATKKD